MTGDPIPLYKCLTQLSFPSISDNQGRFLSRGLFSDEFEDEPNVNNQLVENCDLDSNCCVLMTLNRDRSVYTSGTAKPDDSEVIQLNVGGIRYTTTKSTLTSRESDAFFARLLQARFKLLLIILSVQAAEISELPEPWGMAACRLDSGAYFIDRDGELFAYVLDYLRNGKLLLPDNFKEIARLREEALFYQIEGMVQQIMPYFSIK